MLAGIRVLDLTRLLPGPAATVHLADWGADVIKVEDCEAGDYLRDFPPLLSSEDGTPLNPIFEAANRGKRSVRLDLKSSAGKSAFMRLVETADAVIESFRPGVMSRLGIDYAQLAGHNPRIVLVSISGYGQDGPLALTAGHDINYCALAGVLDQNRSDDGVPAIPNLQIGDLLGGALASLSSLLAALLSAQRSGRGCHIDCAMTEAMLAHHYFANAAVDTSSDQTASKTLLTGGVPGYRVYAAADGRYLAVGALELKFWQSFCDAIGLPELRELHWTRDLAPGSEASKRVIEQVASRMRERTRDDWMHVFAGVDACITPVLSPVEALAHPQTKARGLVHRERGVTMVAPMTKISGLDVTFKAAPRGGHHTIEVLNEAGYTRTEVDALLASGAARGDSDSNAKGAA